MNVIPDDLTAVPDDQTCWHLRLRDGATFHGQIRVSSDGLQVTILAPETRCESRYVPTTQPFETGDVQWKRECQAPCHICAANNTEYI